ncbi:hypothetical protein AB536_11725 [Listeria monocytogenes]|nr:hypothetical protein [Listeria monocytogenes]
MYLVEHKDSKMTWQVYNYFYPEQEKHSATQFAQFIKQKTSFSNLRCSKLAFLKKEALENGFLTLFHPKFCIE